MAQNWNIFTAFWMDTTTAPWTPLTSLSPTITIKKSPWGAIVVNAEAMTDIGDGWYEYVFSGYTGATVLDTSYTTDLPAVNTGMAFKAEINNGAVASAANLDVAKIYIETDY